MPFDHGPLRRPMPDDTDQPRRDRPMSILETHEAEQDAITTAYEAQQDRESGAEIRKLMCLSIAHISEETDLALADQFNQFGDSRIIPDPPIAVGGPYDDSGYILYAMEPAHRLPGIPADLLAIYDYALKYGCQNILLDKDADTVDALPTYDW